METLKLIFLDIDGVLNSNDYAEWCATTDEGKQYIKEGGHHWVDRAVVNRIINICIKTGAGIVLSSSWRCYNIEETKKELNRYRDLMNISGRLIGITPRLKMSSSYRGPEIQWFLDNMNKPPIDPYNRFYEYEYFKNCKHKTIKYCIVDDDTDMLPEQMDNFVHIDFMTGLTDEDAEKIINILNND